MQKNMYSESPLYQPSMSGSTYFEVSLRPLCYPLADATNPPDLYGLVRLMKVNRIGKVLKKKAE